MPEMLQRVLPPKGWHTVVHWDKAGQDHRVSRPVPLQDHSTVINPCPSQAGPIHS